MSYTVHDLRGIARLDPGAGGLSRVSAMLYGMGTRLYHRLYDLGWLPRRRAGLPVVSIGAVSVGGSGKTPTVRWLASRLTERGYRPAILSRGYRSRGGRRPRVLDPARPDADRNGDEPTLLARSLPEVPVVVAPDRLRGARVAARHGAEILLLDDGFQHRRLHRDLDVVLWDRRAACSAGRLLPTGFLRETPRALRRADVLLLVDRGEGAPEPPPHGPPAGRVFRAHLRSFSRHPIEPGTRVHALTGIADPESFERALSDLGLSVTGSTRYRDHHPFSASEIGEAAARAAAEGADHLAVTAKDRVRWPPGEAGPLPVPAVFDVDVRLESEDLLLEIVTSLLQGAPR